MVQTNFLPAAPEGDEEAALLLPQAARPRLRASETPTAETVRRRVARVRRGDGEVSFKEKFTVILI
jgi:hypothetical protein